MTLPEVLIIGGGIAGLGLGHALAGSATVTLLEREPHCGYHATGRSVANFTEALGSPVIRRLTMGSRAFLADPPPGFCQSSILSPRPVITIGRDEQIDTLAEKLELARILVPSMRVLDPAEVEQRVPILRRGYVAWAMIEPNAMDMDLAGLQAGYLKGLRQRRCYVVTDADVIAIGRTAGQWNVQTAHAGRFRADFVVNAAGAWADQVAAMAGVTPLGLQPQSRTVIQIDPPAGTNFARWPTIDDANGEFYFRPQGGALIISPADMRHVPPTDAQPEDQDISTAIERFQRATTLTVERVRHAWAGLRTFAADSNPVVGQDGEADGFIWLAGQGGYGIKTSPALSRIAASVILGRPFPAELAALGLTAATLAPQRLRS